MPSALQLPVNSAARRAVARTLEAVSTPAFAALPDGSLLLANQAAASLLHDSTPDGVPCFRGSHDGAADACWRSGIAAGEPFVLDLPGSGRLHASPVLDLGADGRGWLVIQEKGEDDAVADAPLADPQHLAPALNTALQAGRMGLWEWDQATNTAYWNPPLYDILRLPRGSGIESPERFMSFIIPEDRPVLDDVIEQLQRDGEYPPVRLRVRVGDGSVRWLVSCGQVASSASRGPVVVGVNIDVTAQVQAEEELQRARDAGQRQQRIVESVLEHVPVGIAVSVNGDQHISLVSRFGLDMIESEEDEGRQWDTWQVYHLDGKTPARKEEMALHRAAQGAVIRNEEWLIRRADGSLLPVSCAAGPIRAADGTFSGGIVAWYDVTPFKEMEAERRNALAAEQEARSAAEEANRQKDLFVGMVSHELRTPLSAILGWTQVLEKKPEPAAVGQGIQAIARNARTLARLVDDLLDVTRIAAGKLELDMQEADLGDIVDAAVQTVLPAARARGVTIQWSRPPLPVPVLADALRLQQAVWNLLSNAIKFSDEAGLVLAKLEMDEARATLTVTDHGQGLAPALLSKVFERFWQGQAHTGEGRRGGLGLGLSIARHIVERHVGELSAASAGVGCGATFTLTVPLQV